MVVGSSDLARHTLAWQDCAVRTASCLCWREVFAVSRVAASVHAAFHPALCSGPPVLYILGGGRRITSDSALNLLARHRPACEWSPRPAMFVKRDGPAAAVIDGLIYVAGGCNRTGALASAEKYDPELRVWERLPDMGSCRDGPAGYALGACFYVCGGCPLACEGTDRLTSVERLSTKDSIMWEGMPCMNERRFGAIAASLNGYLYVCGGGDGERRLQSAERFDLTNNRWECIPSMAAARDGATAVVVNGCLIVCGGNDGTQNLASVELFDPRVWVWQDMPPMRRARDGPASATLAGLVYVFGGIIGSSRRHRGVVSATAECFDPRTRHWEELPPMRIGVRAGAVAVTIVERRDIDV